MDDGLQRKLFSSLVSDIKRYSGEDPLPPWIQGIRKMQGSLPPQVLKEKLPRFLQKCAQAFESNPKYRDDSRYLRVWIQLMDYVDDARAILRKMEKNQIGLKRAVFYSAYAMYYEKRKKFEDAERMYQMGVQNLAEPAAELQRSYEQFLHRMKIVRRRRTKMQEAAANSGKSTSNGKPIHHDETKIIKNFKMEGYTAMAGDALKVSCPSANFDPEFVKGGNRSSTSRTDPNRRPIKRSFEHHKRNTVSDDTVVVKFVGSAIVGKSESESYCHHGLVEPTINTKEAMNAISSMFREPLDPEPVAGRRPLRSKQIAYERSSGFEVYVDENPEIDGNPGFHNQPETEMQEAFVGGFSILADDDEDDDSGGVHSEERTEPAARPSSASDFLKNDYRRSKACNGLEVGISGLREDTVVRRFVGSTVFGDPEVENACHHGLVDPTVNMKEAMDDINSMFGEPLNYVKANKPKKQSKKPASVGFCILADDLREDSKGQPSASVSRKSDRGGDLFEPTILTKEAMAEINEMFGKPLDF